MEPHSNSHVVKHRLTTPDNHELGVWVVKKNSREEGKEKKKMKVVIVYFHGNADTRALYRRQYSYQAIIQSFSRSLPPSIASSSDLELVTFDYRGFGDSEGSPSEDGVVTDGMTIYQFVVEQLKADSVFFWGHSLGTGISTRVAKRILVDDPQPAFPPPPRQLLRGLILEAPFRSVREAALNHWVGYPIRWLPSSLFNLLFDHIPDRFETEIHLPLVAREIRVAILHGKQDMVVHSYQGKHLYVEGQRKQLSPSRSILFHEFERAGHNDVTFQQEFGSVIARFIETVTWGV